MSNTPLTDAALHPLKFGRSYTDSSDGATAQQDALTNLEVLARELEAQLAAARAEIRRHLLTVCKLREALILILPMAKGYAHEHNVGGNQGKVSAASGILKLTRDVDEVAYDGNLPQDAADIWNADR